MSTQNQKRLENVASADTLQKLQELRTRRGKWDQDIMSPAERMRSEINSKAAEYSLMLAISINNGDVEPSSLSPGRERYVRTKLSEEDQQELDRLDGEITSKYFSNKPMHRDEMAGERDRLLCKASKGQRGTRTCTEEEFAEYERKRLETRSRGWGPTKTGLITKQEIALINSMSPDRQEYFEVLEQAMSKAHREGNLESFRAASDSRAGDLRQACRDQKGS